MAYHLRTPDELASCFDGLTLLEPGIVSCVRWRPDGMGMGFRGPAAWRSNTAIGVA
ncbi:MAG TPA: SAM-dependent methyltransferase [Pseudonocardia sp.]